MAFQNTLDASQPERRRVLPGENSEQVKPYTSAVSWSAITAGASAIAALSLILLTLGTGLGLSSISPWSNTGISATTFSIWTIIWLTLTQIASSGMGGYLTGRLRTRWLAVPTDEVYFRDGVHGFLAWAVAAVVTAALLTSTLGSMANSGVQAGAYIVAAESNMTKADGDSGPVAYFVDGLFRMDMNPSAIYDAEAEKNAMIAGTSAQSSTRPSANAPSVNTTGEIGRIFLASLATKTLSPEDVRYIGGIVAQHTGLVQKDAEKRVLDTYARMERNLGQAETIAKETADKVRKASIFANLWLFVSLLVGAFTASLSATYGGRAQDA